MNLDAATRRELNAAAMFGRKQKATSNGGMVVTSHPVATRVGTEVLRAGGNACDAALAAAVTQTVVEPHMTTLCGMLSLLYHDAAAGETSYVSGAMAAPLAPLPGFNAFDLFTGRGVAIPGFWAAFEAALGRHGTKSAAELLAPAITIAQEGFEIHPCLYGMMFEHAAHLGRSDYARSTFFRDGALAAPGSVLQQPELARTLERLATEGSEYFYRGDWAERFVNEVKGAGGVITREDMERYEARWMEPATGSYRGRKIIGSPPPDNGGTHLIEILNLLELLDVQSMGLPYQSADLLYWIIRFCVDVYLEGSKQRDPASTYVPLEVITSKEYAATRFELMRMTIPIEIAAKPPYPGSCHVTAVDADGNVATSLHSVMSLPWMNGLFVDGIPVWAAGAHFLRAMPKPGERAIAFIAPHIIFEDDKPVLAGGSPSQSLLQNIVQNTVNILDFGMDIEESVHLPRVGGLTTQSFLGAPPTTMVEVDIDAGIRTEIARRGVLLDVTNQWQILNGSYDAVHIDPQSGMRTACADPRRTGSAESA